MIGTRVDDVYGAKVGTVTDIYVDARSGEGRWLLVRLGRMGHEYALVPCGDTLEGGGHVWVPFERDAIRSTRSSAAPDGLTREQELALCHHYRIPVPSALADAAGTDVTALPRSGAAAARPALATD